MIIKIGSFIQINPQGLQCILMAKCNLCIYKHNLQIFRFSPVFYLERGIIGRIFPEFINYTLNVYQIFDEVVRLHL